MIIIQKIPRVPLSDKRIDDGIFLRLAEVDNKMSCIPGQGDSFRSMADDS